MNNLQKQYLLILQAKAELYDTLRKLESTSIREPLSDGGGAEYMHLYEKVQNLEFNLGEAETFFEAERPAWTCDEWPKCLMPSFKQAECPDCQQVQESVAKANTRKAYFIQQTLTDEQGNFIPCVAVEGEPGYYKTDWTWGSDFEWAQKCADEMNEQMGIDSKTAMLIQLGTMGGGS